MRKEIKTMDVDGFIIAPPTSFSSLFGHFCCLYFARGGLLISLRRTTVR